LKGPLTETFEGPLKKNYKLRIIIIIEI